MTRRAGLRISAGLIIVALVASVLLALPATGQAACYTPAQAPAHVGEQGCVEGTITTVTFAQRSNGQPTFLDFGRSFTAVIWIEDRPKFSPPPESLRGRQMRVSGTISTYEGKAEIIVRDPGQLGPASAPLPAQQPPAPRQTPVPAAPSPAAPAPPPAAAPVAPTPPPAAAPVPRVTPPPPPTPAPTAPPEPTASPTLEPTPEPTPSPSPTPELSPSPTPSPTPAALPRVIATLASLSSDEEAAAVATPAVEAMALTKPGNGGASWLLIIGGVLLMAAGASVLGWYEWRRRQAR